MPEKHVSGGRNEEPPWPATPGFRLVSHTADFAVAGRGENLAALFRVMAHGLFALVLEEGEVASVVTRSVHLKAASPTDLLHDWLQEINGLHQVHGEVYCDFQVHPGEGELHGSVSGEAMDPVRHRIQHEIKGVTWHDLKLVQDGDQWCAYVLVDV